MAARVDFYKEFLENTFDNIKYTKVSEDNKTYKFIKNIIEDLGYKTGPSDAYDAGDKDSLELGSIYFGEPTDTENYTEEYDGKHYVIVLFGGLNGSGDWKDYIDTFAKVFDALDEKCKDSWLIELQNDCADDVYSAYIGIRLDKKLDEQVHYNRSRSYALVMEFLNQMADRLNQDLPKDSLRQSN